ncbi:MAG TPA: glycosyltransferase family 39 protein [Rhizomicrobium sp.]|nr:glycosyltransferase family 39 protein [Rhizomicrobium sp.]
MSEINAAPNRVTAAIRKHPLLILFTLCLIAWLPGFFTIPPLDRDESRFAEASKQMLETRNFIDIRFGREPRYKKPVGIYWLQAAATEAASPLTHGARDRIWTYRIPSLIGALAAVALTFRLAAAFLDVETAFLSALLLGLTILLGAEAKIAKTDAALLATVIGAQGALLRAYLARDPDQPRLTFFGAMLGWLSFALGVLIKGPVILGVCGATVLALVLWDRKWRWLGALRPLRGLLLTAIVVAPWLVAIALQSHGAFYQQSLGHDFAAKLAGGQESHGEPPGYYLLMTTITFWPATLFLAPAIAAAIASRAQPAARFLLAWAGACWLLFELVPTKLPHYVLPVYPALAVMSAAFVSAPPGAGSSFRRRALTALSTVHFLAGAAILAAGVVILPRLYGPGVSPELFGLAATIAAVSLLAGGLALAGRRGAAAALATLAAIVATSTLTMAVMPKLDRFWVSPREAELVAAHRRSGDPPPALAGYTEPSAMFLIGSSTRLTDGAGAAEIGAAEGGLALIEDGQRGRFLARLAELEADATPIDSLAGFNYSRGRPVRITLYRVSPARGPAPGK